LNQTVVSNIENEGYNALSEYLASCSVIVTSEVEGFQHGTGVAVRYDNQDYILTARHVLDQESDNVKIMVLGRTGAPYRDVRKNQIAANSIHCLQKRDTFSQPTHIDITRRLVGKENEDIAAIKVQNAYGVLPHTVFHDLSGQRKTRTSAGLVVAICGFPGELAVQVKHRLTGQRGAAAFLHFAHQEIKKISDAPKNLHPKLDPKVDLVTDFIDDEKTCDPEGMSGCGVWSIPRCKEGKLWSSRESQLLGIQSGIYPLSKLLRFVRIERVLSLLSGS